MEINKPSRGTSSLHSLKNYSKARSFFLLILLFATALGMAGCVTLTDFEASQVNTSEVVGEVNAQNSIGQSFISRRPELNGITLWLTPSTGEGNLPSNTGQNSLTIKLFHSPEESLPVFTTTILAPATGTNLPVYIEVSALNNIGDQAYYLQLTKNSGSVQINGRNEDAYPHGQAYNNGNPIQADIAFRLSYAYGFSTLARDIAQGLGSIWLVLPLLTLLWLPGWLVLEFTGLRMRYDFGEQTGMSIGFSLAVIPLLMLWTTILKITWTRSGILFFAGFLVALFIVRLIYKLIFPRSRTPELDPNPLLGPPNRIIKRLKFPAGISIALLFVFISTLTTRFIMVRDLATPAWVDSIHHALITRLILSSGAYPTSYLPYWDFPPAAYHPGFHSIVAAFTWLTDLSLDRSLLIVGQVLNALLVFSVYLVCKSLTRSSSAGLIAAIITGFMTPMPAYYTSWGRYTELTGLLILPVAFVLIKSVTEWQSNKRNYAIIPLGMISVSGLLMVHYRVTLFLVCLTFSFLLVYLVGHKNNLSISPGRILLVVLLVAVGGILLVYPWLSQTVTGTVIPYIRTTTSSSVPFFEDFSWAYLDSALGKQSLVLAGLGLAWGLIKRVYFPGMLVIWIVLLFIFANLSALHLPGGSLINNTSVEIMLFMPISILAGYFLDQLIKTWSNFVPQRLNFLLVGIITLIIGFVAFSGAKQLVAIINPVTILSREADLPAIEWINENIPENETIVTNPFAWGYGVFAGNDGGSWISPLTGRLTMPPPVLYALGNERNTTNELSQKVIDLSSEPAALKEFLISNQLHYIYVGARGGVLSSHKLASSGLFNTLYQKDGVWIFAVKP